MFTPGSNVNRTTEEFRLIKRALLERIDKARAEGAANANLVMVTSTREGEGKTFVALNLAFSLAAERDHSVILIDADPAKSSVAQFLQLRVERGLIDLLQDDTLEPEDVVLATSIEGLSILPAGHHHALGAELFASDRMGALLRAVCVGSARTASSSWMRRRCWRRASRVRSPATWIRRFWWSKQTGPTAWRSSRL